MSGNEGAAVRGPAQRYFELFVALLIALFGVIVVYGAIKAGIGWSFDGPQAGFFPFYLGVIILAATMVNLFNTLRVPGTEIFAEWSQLRQVSFVTVPLVAFVVLIHWIGIYFSGALLIAFFMRWVGRHGWIKIALVSLCVPLAIFFVFERWFLVALPKGPIEYWLGF